MKTIRSLCVLLVAVSFCSACSKEDPKPTGSAEQKPVAAVAPGSYEDWCDEHGVPESQCTRCNPSLTAAFKATGDWCEEHGMPESQCLACNPDLKIVRAAKGP